MIKNSIEKYFVFLLVFIFILPNLCLAVSTIGEKLSGRILLQVEDNGEAWYISPTNHLRYFLGRPDDAFELMRSQGIGITNSDLSKIRPALEGLSGADIDADGLPDSFEIAIGTYPDRSDSDSDGHSDREEIMAGYDPFGQGKLLIDNVFATAQSGKIFLQTQKNGEAWYISPTNNQRYYLGRPADAFAVMRSLSLGINNNDLSKIGEFFEAETVGASSPLDAGVFNLLGMEKTIHAMINNEREANGLPVLLWNDNLSAVARAHSQALAEENKTITDIDIICDYPIIHHEGLSGGFNVSQRLEEADIYNFSKNGENIALVAAGTSMFLSGYGESNVIKVEECRQRLFDWEKNLKEQLELEDSEAIKISIIISEIKKRKDQLAREVLKIEDITWESPEETMDQMVDGWMNSPGHRANILDFDFDEAGIGLSYVNGYIIGTQVFIKKASCGYQDGSCCERGGCYLPLSCHNDNICR